MILGISVSHCSAAALIDKEGNILGVASEERFTRIKDESGFPKEAIKYLIKDIDPKEITHVAFGASFWQEPSAYYSFKKRVIDNKLRDKFERNIFYTFICFLEYLGLVFKRIKPEDYFRQALKELGLGEVEISFIDHHYAHALGSYYASKIDDPLMVTVDGIGDNKSATVNVVKDDKVKVIHKSIFDGSPGSFYSLMTALCGFKPNRHEGKVTGLAAIGEAKKLPEMEDMLVVDRKGDDLFFSCPLHRKIRKLLILYTPVFIYEYIKWYIRRGTYEEFISMMEQTISRYLFRDIIKKKAEIKDIAAAAQDVLEKRVGEFIEYYVKKEGKKNLALSGGVFANVKLNQRLFNIDGVEGIYVHPGMGDEGTSLGAAYGVLAEVNPQVKRQVLKTVYLGPDFSSEEIKTALDKEGIKYRQVKDSKELAQTTAKYISEGKIIGLFKGRMEYGPRALGARSVLADPRKKEMHDILNNRMKRTEFMPFAPVIAYKQAHDVIEGKIKGSEHTAEFMTITYDVKEKWHDKIPAVVHVDGTARPQLIKRENNPLYYDIVVEFGNITGVPVIINTSFNIHEEPIVCTPEDAIRSYKQGCVDIMVMEDILVGEEKI
jgi:carbamoyltransferase